jgi:hypothetical protein
MVRGASSGGGVPWNRLTHMRTSFTAALAVGVAITMSAQTPAPTAVFTNVTIIPMDRERTQPNMSVWIGGDRIIGIRPSDNVPPAKGVLHIDGRGKFLMPGIAEMHAHIPGGNQPDAFMHRVLALFVANGVTTIRGMLGDPRHLPLRAAVGKGDVIGPSIFTSGPSFSANSVKSVEGAVKMVQEQKAAGYDFLKIHPGVPRAAFDALAAEANKLKMPFSGHVPAEVGLERALTAKYRSIDHIDGYFEYAVKPDAPVDRANPGFFGANFTGHLDPARLKKAVADTKAAGVWIVPTQGLLEIFMSPATADQLRKSPGVDLIPPQQVEAWAKQRAQFMSTPDFTAARNEQFLRERRALLKALHDAGVDIVLGSDAIQTFSVPGFSLQIEMQAMAKAGLTPYQIYVTGTRNVARFFGRESEVGTVAEGKLADLVLLDANPLTDVANFAKQTGTMTRGRWYPRQELLANIRTMNP